MQINLPDIKQLLTEWYLLTLENPLYAGALVLSVWLLTVFFYTIRIYFLNRRQRVIEQAGIIVQGLLDEAQQQNKESDEKLIALTEQVKNEQQLATEFAAKVDQRNQQIVENIKQLASQFSLSEQLVASDKKPEPDFVWQQQDNIQMQLTERLQAENHEKNTLQETYKQEKEHFSKQKIVIEQLQKTLDFQASKSVQLEQDLNTQRELLQQQKNVAEQDLANKLSDLQAKHELDVASLVNELNQQKEALDIAVEEKEVVATEIKATVTPAIVEKRQESEVVDLSASMPDRDIKNLFSAPPKPIDNSDLGQQTEELVVEVSAPEAGEFEIESEKIAEVLATEVSLPEPEEVDLEPDYTVSNLDIAGKFKGLFGKDKKQADKAEQVAEVLATEVSLPEPEEVDSEPDYIASKLNIAGKFKRLFGKDKKLADKPEHAAKVLATGVSLPEPEEVDSEPDYIASKLDIAGKFKGLFGKGKKQPGKSEKAVEVLVTDVSIPEPEEVDSGPEYTASNLDIAGKFKGLFGKDKAPVVKPESEQQAAVLTTEVPMPQTEEIIAEVRGAESEEQHYDPDYIKSNLHIPDKLKKLFGKS